MLYNIKSQQKWKKYMCGNKLREYICVPAKDNIQKTLI